MLKLLASEGSLVAFFQVNSLKKHCSETRACVVQDVEKTDFAEENCVRRALV